MSRRAKACPRLGNIAFGAAVFAGALVVAWVVASINGQQAALNAQTENVRVLAEQGGQLAAQVRELGGTPVVSPSLPASEPGPPGISGLRGSEGRQGRPGRPPSAGELLAAATQALAANPPAPGKVGRAGRDGTNGVNGADGKDGRNGMDGANGTNGEKGDPGPPPTDEQVDAAVARWMQEHCTTTAGVMTCSMEP